MLIQLIYVVILRLVVINWMVATAVSWLLILVRWRLNVSLCAGSHWLVGEDSCHDFLRRIFVFHWRTIRSILRLLLTRRRLHVLMLACTLSGDSLQFLELICHRLCILVL